MARKQNLEIITFKMFEDRGDVGRLNSAGIHFGRGRIGGRASGGWSIMGVTSNNSSNVQSRIFIILSMTS
jgi:hypothetical protein